MPRQAAKKYGPGGQYYRKRIKTPEGKYEDIYARTQADLAEKVTLRLNQLAALSDVPPQELYFFEYAAGFYARREPHMSAGARKMYKYQINKVICPMIGAKPIRDVTSDDLAAILATRAHLSRSSQQKTVLVIKQIFDAALDAGVIERLPSRRLRPGGKPTVPKHAITEAQQAALLDAVRGLKVETCVMLALYTGMRREEICALRWDAVELTGKAPHIIVRRACRWPSGTQPEVSEIVKTDAAYRTIPLPPVLVTWLADLKASVLAGMEPAETAALRIRSRYVYGNDDGSPISMTTFRRRWETIRSRSTESGRPLGEKVRNQKFSVTIDFYPKPHQLRRTYVTRLILGGMDVKRVQYLAGHADPQITIKIYTDLMGHAPEDLIDDVTAIFTPRLPLTPPDTPTET